MPPTMAPPPKTTAGRTANVASQDKPQQMQEPVKTKIGLPIVLNAVEGFGKTTLGAFAENSAFILSPQEMGYLTLFQYDRVPKRPYVVVDSWLGLLGQIDSLIANPAGVEWLVLDALVGFEHLCHKHVCKTEFSDDWGEKGFVGYQRGFELGAIEWIKLLSRLDSLRTKHAVNILMLSHLKIKMFSNPLGADFDRYVADCHHKTWGVTHKWADAVLFGNFFQIVQEVKKDQPKGVGNDQRVIYTQHTDAYDAKNRLGMPESIDIPNDPAKSWEAIHQHISRKGSS